MKLTKRRARGLITFALCGLVFEAVAFSDFDGALADDLKLLEYGASTGAGAPPVNMVFVFDSSGSMNNLICEELTGSLECDSGSVGAKAAPNSSTVCESSALEALTGPDVDGNGSADPYQGAFASDGYTWSASLYPAFDARGSYDDVFVSWTTLSHTLHSPYSTRLTGSGTTDQNKIEDVIDTDCGSISSCEKRQRCVYSLRTQGYFWEPTGSSCGSGDPLGLCTKCGDGTCQGAENACNCSNDCAETCGDGCCTGSETPCTCDADCGAPRCGDSVCCSGDPADADCTVDCDPGSLGSACNSNSDCDSENCRENVCSACDNDYDCSGYWNYCIRSNSCAHSYCSYDGPSGCKVTDPCDAYAAGTEWSCCDYNWQCDDGLECAGYECVVESGGAPSIGSRPIFLGDFFNFYPPKSYALIKAFSDTINNLSGDARIAVSDFGDVGTGGVDYDIEPTCTSTKGDMQTPCFDGKGSTHCFNPSSSTLQTYLYGTLAFNNMTPLARALDNAGRYFTDTTGAPICDYSGITTCATAKNVVILISDGFPSSDATSASQLPHSNTNITGFSNSYAYDNHEWVDDVAKRLTEIDHRSDLSGQQAVSTYTVSFGLINADDPTTCVGLMQQTALAGGGACLPAASADELRDALTNIVLDVTTEVQGFTAPSLPTTRSSSEAGLATAAFFPKASYSLWEGHIYGFEVCDENLPGTTCECGDAGDPTELCVLDASGTAPAMDASDGYLDASSPPFWDAALCLAKDPANLPTESAGSLAPDRGDLSTSSCYKSASTRTIYTAVDRDSDGDLDQIPFTEASIDAYTVFRDAVKPGDTAGAKKIVSYYRGVDTFDADGDSNVTEDRNLATIRDASGNLLDGWWKLGDIFHSIPGMVERPNGRGVGRWSNTESYGAFEAEWTDRDRVMLVGANDGMLHAFKTGTWDSTDEEYDTDSTAGSELWAYVTPEMLPTLGSVCDAASAGCSLSSHVPMVDGSVMVRDIWIGGTASKEDSAQKSNWKTVAVVGHRRGGRTYVAIDVTDISSPQLLWRFPEPGSAQDALVGQSWLDVFPAPASIGPLMVENAGGNIYDKWVVLLSGGFDAAASRGNALFVLDAWTGDVLWQTTDTGAGDDTDAMDYSFPATPVFYANMGSLTPGIAGIVAADVGGQIWHVTPADTVVDETSPDFDVEIVFRSVASLVAPDARGGNSDGTVDFAEYQPRPFFFAPTLTRMGGQVRVILGTGDRDMLIPHGSVPPSGDVLGAACTVDGDCASGTCDSGYCSECSSDGDCTSPDTCINTECGYHYCSSSACDVPVGGNDVSLAINDAICTYEQRLYALNLSRCSDGAGGTRPCVESDLVEIVDGTTYANQSHHGWYYVLDPGEKVSAPYDVLSGFALYSTFVPTVACGSGSVPLCTPSAKGVGRMHIRSVVTGESLLGPGFVELGTGVPSAPSITVALGNGDATPTLLNPKDPPLPISTSLPGMEADLIMEIMRFPVSKDLHGRLHEQ